MKHVPSNVSGIVVQKLSDIKGLSEAKVEKLLDAARKLCTDYGWRSATRVEQQVDMPTACVAGCILLSVQRLASNSILGQSH